MPHSTRPWLPTRKPLQLMFFIAVTALMGHFVPVPVEGAGPPASGTTLFFQQEEGTDDSDQNQTTQSRQPEPTEGQSREGGANLAEGNQGVIVTGSPESRDAGLKILQAGGNAMDAAVAAMLVQSVVENHLFCFGSEVPILFYQADRGTVEVIAGLGAAPQLATPEWFRENRKGLIQGRGDIANAVVPGFLDACLTGLSLYGTLTFADCAQPMLEVLQERSDPQTAQQSMNRRSRLRRGNEASPQRLEAFIQHHQNFLQLIQRLVQAESNELNDRLTGLRQVSDYFYRGPVAEELDAWSQENGGLLRFVDLAQHVTRIDTPLKTEFHDYTVYKCGVWTQGPYLLQALRILDGFDLPQLGHNSPDYIHLVTETIKLSMADRDAYFADPHFVKVPIDQLMSDEYIELRRSLIDMQTAAQEQQPGDPIQMKGLLGTPPQDHQITSGHSNDTTSCLVADQWGNVVSATPSGWGGVIAGSTGIELGSRMIGLTTWENHPSILAPGKRPRITLTPTLVFKGKQPVMAISVAGGDQQDQASLQVLLNRLVFQLEPLAAVQTLRFGTDHHINWFGHEPAKPGSLTVPRELTSDISSLRSRGHRVNLGRPAASAVILTIDPETGLKQVAGERGRFAGGH